MPDVKEEEEASHREGSNEDGGDEEVRDGLFRLNMPNAPRSAADGLLEQQHSQKKAGR